MKEGRKQGSKQAWGLKLTQIQQVLSALFTLFFSIWSYTCNGFPIPNALNALNALKNAFSFPLLPTATVALLCLLWVPLKSMFVLWKRGGREGFDWDVGSLRYSM